MAKPSSRAPQARAERPTLRRSATLTPQGFEPLVSALRRLGAGPLEDGEAIVPRAAGARRAAHAPEIRYLDPTGIRTTGFSPEEARCWATRRWRSHRPARRRRAPSGPRSGDPLP